jgi:hypothetical protein
MNSFKDYVGPRQDAGMRTASSSYERAIRRKALRLKAKAQVEKPTMPLAPRQQAAPLSAYIENQVPAYQPGVMPWLAALKGSNQ